MHEHGPSEFTYIHVAHVTGMPLRFREDSARKAPSLQSRGMPHPPAWRTRHTWQAFCFR